MNPPSTSAIEELRNIVARLRAPDGCPWDREQTHASLKNDLIEEAYEVLEAIDTQDDPLLREELGDFLLQVVMHSQIAAEQNRFTFDDVAKGVAEKLVRRHPHVFGDRTVNNTEAVLKQWDQIKREEKGGTESILDHISAGLPALMRAEKVQKKVARVGFDWPDLQGVLDKVREEIAEIEAAAQSGDHKHLEEEIGDLLFCMANLSRKTKCNAELLLQAATDKFIRRFKKLEVELQAQGKGFEGMPLAELDLIWDKVKAAERAQH